MTNQKIPLKTTGINEDIYAGFGVRLTSLILDFIILLPIFLLTLYVNGLNLNSYYFTFIPYYVFNFWYYIYLVKKYGGTPGKLILGIKIVKIDGNDVTWREAILRDIVSLMLGFFYIFIIIYSISKADSDQFENISWLKKQTYLLTFSPLIYPLYKWADNIWIGSELVVLLFNKRRRAIHDYIANTVIVKKIYLAKFRQEINSEQV